MFFKRSKGDFRETERITRYKLINQERIGYGHLSRG